MKVSTWAEIRRLHEMARIQEYSIGIQFHPYIYEAGIQWEYRGIKGIKCHPYMYCADSRILVDFQPVPFISIRFAIAGGHYG